MYPKLVSTCLKAKLNLVLNKVTFNGKGDLLAPTRLESKAKIFRFSVLEENEKIIMYMKGFSSTSNFESQNTYISSADINSFKLVMVGINDNVDVNLEKIRLNASSNDQGSETELSSKISFHSMDLNSSTLSFNIKEFNMDVALAGIDKKLFEELRTLKDPQAVQIKTTELLSKGFTLNIADYSTKDITINKVGQLGGFDMKSNIKFKADPSFAQKIKSNPMMIVKSIDMKMTLRVSKKILTLLTQANPMVMGVIAYAKEENNSYVFDILLSNAKATVNGKQLN